MIQDYYETYLQMLERKKQGKNGKKTSRFLSAWKELDDRENPAEPKGVSFRILLVSYVATSVLWLVTLFPATEYQTPFWKALFSCIFLLWFILVSVMNRRNKKWRESLYFLNIPYFEALENAAEVGREFHSKFRFSTKEQFQMILTDAEQHSQELSQQSQKYRHNAEQVLFGGILAGMLAVVPAVLTGIMDNFDKLETIMPFLQSIFTACFGILFSLGWFYFVYNVKAWKIEKKQKAFAYFRADIKMLTEILSGLHPSSDLVLENKEVTP